MSWEGIGPSERCAACHVEKIKAVQELGFIARSGRALQTLFKIGDGILESVPDKVRSAEKI